jgi:hypothetical protein
MSGTMLMSLFLWFVGDLCISVLEPLISPSCSISRPLFDETHTSDSCSCPHAAALASVRIFDDAGDPNKFCMFLDGVVMSLAEVFTMFELSRLNLATNPSGVDCDCEKLSEFPINIYACPPFFLYLRFTVWVLAHARTNQLSTMMETMSG